MTTAECVSRGHPDKVCDQISDAILDEFLKQDENAKVAVETMATGKHIILGGEINSHATIDYEQIVRFVLKDIGYTDQKYGLDYRDVKITNLINKQSPEINQGVEDGGAGDQGIMYGFATDETDELLPLPYVLARNIILALDEKRKTNPIYGPDAKSQVTVQNGKATCIVVAQQHTNESVVNEVTELVKELLSEYITKNTRIVINGTGSFNVGGPGVDCGLTGRKTQVDSYGGLANHGGGAFSGKDPTKVDRSAAYFARHVACEQVRKNGGSCLVSVSYAIGKAQPCEVSIEGYNFEPEEIIKQLDLKKPQYYKTAQHGHFGRNFTWD